MAKETKTDLQVTGCQGASTHSKAAEFRDIYLLLRAMGVSVKEARAKVLRYIGTQYNDSQYLS